MKKTIEKQSKSADSFKYSGKVTVKILDGDRLLSTKHYHNTGCPKLFQFFTDCLSGNYEVAKNTRPCQIILFKQADDETLGTFNKLYWNNDTKVSSSVFYDSAATPGQVDNASTITYHFRIPFLCLVNGAKIAKIGLYPELIDDFGEDLCAYHFLDDEIQIPYGGGNFTVVVDWTLRIRNITKKEEN